MSRLIAIDPSMTRIGVAIFDDGDLTHTHVVRGSTPTDMDRVERIGRIAQETLALFAHEACEHMVFEWPQIYERAKSKGDPNSIMLLAGVCAAIGAQMQIAHGTQLHSYKPKEWAGNVPKDTTVSGCKFSPRAVRIRRRLSIQELVVWDLAKYDDEIDAIGIGLKWLGRYEKRITR